MMEFAARQLEQLLQHQSGLRSQWEKERKSKDVPRVNGFGLFTRTTSLDKLLQLINVIRGEMILVCTRTVVVAELARCGDEVDCYLMARPDMMGLWQIGGRSDLNYVTRVYLGTWYIKSWSLWQNLNILLKTVDVGLPRSGSH